MNDPVISVDGLTKRYGGVVGIADISFDVGAGEVFGFLGPNGAGKTTTIRLLLHLLQPTSGSMSILGRPVARESLAIRRRCGYLPGDFTGYGQMTGAEFLRFAASLRRMEPVLEDDLLGRFKIAREDLSRKMKYLSHGTRQKLGIIQAFSHDPELLILDEPTAGLDPLMQEAFYDLVWATREKGRTVFLSSHNLPEVEKICGRIAIVREGTLVALETLDDLKHKRYRRMILTLREPAAAVRLAGAELVRQRDLRYEFVVKGAIQPLLKELVGLPIADLVFPEPDLEEVFMAYYEAGEDE